MEDELERLRKEMAKVESLEKMVERLKELVGNEGDKVVVPEKSMETLREEIDTLKRTFDQVMEGQEPDASASTGKAVTPQKKSRAHDPDQPPDDAIAKIVRGKRVEVRREVVKDLPKIEKQSNIYPMCKENYCTQNAFVTHYSKFHKNE